MVRKHTFWHKSKLSNVFGVFCRCMEMVSSNKLYEPVLGDGEAAVWGNIYASQKKKGTPILKVTASAGASSTIDSNTPLIFSFKPMLVPMEVNLDSFLKLKYCDIFSLTYFNTN